ncbi:carboxylesterase/lipase family protein [Belliella marina]|uniref:Carboxylic ester hydrolase n=1 Tax=Belliella marina TaxID=1644146 RepID=A0ABW4VJY8_9BACT
MKMQILGTLLISLLVATSSCSEKDLSLVKVEEGILQGKTENDLVVFKGIPFAAPPVGELRWRSPQPAAEWEGIKQVSEFAPSPYQPGNPPAGKSEDCLYLNIWTPAKSSAEKLPVMVWIYGGGFSFGTTADPITSGTALAQKGVVVVSIAYRVGQLGFMAHPELSAEDPRHVSGNYGLLDQIAGLKWVQKNIEAFGGDPDKVTIFGESAGGISVSMLCASPLAQGLFHRAISQSGGSFGPTRAATFPGENMKTLQQAEAAGISYAQSTGALTLAELRGLDADSLPMGMGMGGAWPIIDGYVLPDDQIRLYEKGKYNDVPVLIGYNSDEGLSFTREANPEDFKANVINRYGEFADTLLSVYPLGENNIPKTARDLNRDAAFGWHTWTWAKLQSQTGDAKVYFYYFDQHPDFPENSPKYGHGSPHGQDVAYVFGTVDEQHPDIASADIKLSETMMSYWTNFAKYGNPNGEGVPEWPTFSTEKPQVMYLKANPQIESVPSEQPLKVLDTYFKWRFTEEGEAWAN